MRLKQLLFTNLGSLGNVSTTLLAEVQQLLRDHGPALGDAILMSQTLKGLAPRTLIAGVVMAVRATHYTSPTRGTATKLGNELGGSGGSGHTVVKKRRAHDNADMRMCTAIGVSMAAMQGHAVEIGALIVECRGS